MFENLIETYPQVAEIFLKMTWNKQEALFDNLFTNDEDSGSSFVNMLVNSINAYNENNKAALAKEIEGLKSDPPVESSLVSVKLIEMVIGYITDYSATKSWTKMSVFCEFWDKISCGYSVTLEYLIERRVLLSLLDLIMQENSILFKADQNRVKMGNSMAQPKFFSLVRAICGLTRYYQTTAAREAKMLPSTMEAIQGKEFIMPEQEEKMLRSKAFFKMLVEQGYAEVSTGRLMAHMCFADLECTQMVIEEILTDMNATEKKNYMNAKKIMEFLYHLLREEDIYQRIRLEELLGLAIVSRSTMTERRVSSDVMELSRGKAGLFENMLTKYYYLPTEDYVRVVAAFLTFCCSSPAVTSWMHCCAGKTLPAFINDLDNKLSKEINALSKDKKKEGENAMKQRDMLLETITSLRESKELIDFRIKPVTPGFINNKFDVITIRLVQVDEDNPLVLFFEETYYTKVEGLEKEELETENTKIIYNHNLKTAIASNIMALEEGKTLVYGPSSTSVSPSNLSAFAKSIVCYNSTAKEYSVKVSLSQQDNMIAPHSPITEIVAKDTVKVICPAMRYDSTEPFLPLDFNIWAEQNESAADSVPALPMGEGDAAGVPDVPGVAANSLQQQDDLPQIDCPSCGVANKLRDNMYSCTSCHRSLF